MTAEWIIAAVGILGLLGTLVGVMIKFSKSVDKNTFITTQILEAQKSQWARLDDHGCKLEDHGDRLVKIETRLDYPEARQ